MMTPASLTMTIGPLVVEHQLGNVGGGAAQGAGGCGLDELERLSPAGATGVGVAARQVGGQVRRNRLARGAAAHAEWPQDLLRDVLDERRCVELSRIERGCVLGARQQLQSRPQVAEDRERSDGVQRGQCRIERERDE
jgi:hypothetical protein